MIVLYSDRRNLSLASSDLYLFNVFVSFVARFHRSLSDSAESE